MITIKLIKLLRTLVGVKSWMLTNICPDPFNPPLPHEEDERWNAYMNELLFILEKNGATIIWEDNQ